MAKAWMAVTARRRSGRADMQPLDLIPSYVDALQLSGFKWKCPFKYRCSQHKHDIFCKSCYRVLTSRLEELGFYVASKGKAVHP
jgi:hypothetical protein